MSCLRLTRATFYQDVRLVLWVWRPHSIMCLQQSDLHCHWCMSVTAVPPLFFFFYISYMTYSSVFHFLKVIYRDKCLLCTQGIGETVSLYPKETLRSLQWTLMKRNTFHKKHVNCSTLTKPCLCILLHLIITNAPYLDRVWEFIRAWKTASIKLCKPGEKPLNADRCELFCCVHRPYWENPHLHIHSWVWSFSSSDGKSFTNKSPFIYYI